MDFLSNNVRQTDRQPFRPECIRFLCIPALQLHQALFSTLQALQILHHAGDVDFGGLVLHVGEPAASYPDDDGHHEDKIFQPVMLWPCRTGKCKEITFAYFVIRCVTV